MASFRAVGLNPMWPTGEGAPPVTSPPAAPLPPIIPAAGFPNTGQLPDYVVDIQAKYYYQESYKQIDGAGNLNALGLLYQVFGESLAYDSGWINARYPILDPSCRSPQSSGGCNSFLASDVATYMPNWAAQFQGSPWRLSFGTSSDFAIVYSVLKYFINPPTNIQTAAGLIATTGILSTLKTGVSNKLGGAPFPTDLPSTVALANALYSKAVTQFKTLTQEGNPALPPSILHAPRPSSALIAAAAVAGKKVDPVFWGILAEAEQLVMKDALAKNNPNEYYNWATTLWSPGPGGLGTMIQNDFGLSLSDFGTFRTPPLATATPETYVATTTVPGPGLKNLLTTAYDPTTGNFALVRGPAGLMGLDSENTSISENYLVLNGPPAPTPNYPSPTTPLTPYPNGFFEVAATGRIVIDGRIVFNTNGTTAVLDYNDQVSATTPTPKYFLKFENEVVTGYSNGAASLWGAAAAGTTNTLSHASQALPGASNTGAWLAANQYGLLKGTFQPVVVSLSDSRTYQPALQFWLVIAEKLGNTGGALPAGYVPPQISTVTYGTPALISPPSGNFRLMNIQSITPTSGAAAKYDHITTDSNKGTMPGTPVPPFPGNSWSLDVGNLFSQTVSFPFATTTNTYLYTDFAPANTIWPLEALTAGPPVALTTTPALLVSSGPGSVPGAILQFFKTPSFSIDPLVIHP